MRCPHCGNKDKRLIETNGSETVLCVALVNAGEDALAGIEPEQEPDANGKVKCGMQWEPTGRRVPR